MRKQDKFMEECGRNPHTVSQGPPPTSGGETRMGGGARLALECFNGHNKLIAFRAKMVPSLRPHIPERSSLHSLLYSFPSAIHAPTDCICCLRGNCRCLWLLQLSSQSAPWWLLSCHVGLDTRLRNSMAISLALSNSPLTSTLWQDTVIRRNEHRST